jgi:hypothetical protein
VEQRCPINLQNISGISSEREKRRKERKKERKKEGMNE